MGINGIVRYGTFPKDTSCRDIRAADISHVASGQGMDEKRSPRTERRLECGAATARAGGGIRRLANFAGAGVD